MNKYKYLTCLFITLSLISCSSNNNITNLVHTEPAYLGDHQLYGYEKGTLRKNNENKYYVSDRFGFAHYLCVTRATKEPDVLFYSAIDTNISYNKKKETNRLTLEDFEVGEQVIFWWDLGFESNYKYYNLPVMYIWKYSDKVELTPFHKEKGDFLKPNSERERSWDKFFETTDGKIYCSYYDYNESGMVFDWKYQPTTYKESHTYDCYVLDGCNLAAFLICNDETF